MPGEQLGPYRILSELGSGGMGTVYLAEAPGARGRVALKVVHPHLLGEASHLRRFLREAEMGKRVDHGNVVRTIDAAGIEEGGRIRHYLVMEYVEGQTLRAVLAELGRVPEELCRHIALEVAKALEAIHAAGVIHRDLKPENVLITDDHLVKVMDLGVARLADEAIRLSQSGAFVGSVLYAAPEQFESAAFDARADLYALGLLLYELSTGKHPFAADDFAQTVRRRLHEEARPAAELNPQLTPFFEEVVRTLLAREPGERFASAAALAGVLAEAEASAWWRGRAGTIRVRPLRRVHLPRETELYGRTQELDRLRALFGRASAGRGQVLLVDGEAGIGKTRLVDDFLSRLFEEEEIHVLYGAYPAGGAATGAGAFSTAYREHFGEEALQETLRKYLTVTPLLVPAFAALLFGDAAPEGEEPLTRDSLQTVFAHATRALAAERPTVIVIDDLHLAPEEGRALFASLALAIRDHRVMLIGLARPVLGEDWITGVVQHDHATRLTLARLGPKDLSRLLTDAFGSERLAEELAFRIAAKSDGNPFFVFEIIRGLREGRLIARDSAGKWVKTQVIRNIEIPSSVLDLIRERIAVLEEDERHLLEVASCCGFEFDPLLVGKALGLARIPLLQRLARIERTHRLVRSAGRRYVFDHHQVQEALWGSLPELLREEYHAALGEALESCAGDPDGALAFDLCEHFLEGARGEKALRYLEPALDHLEKGYLNDAALRLADRALAVPDLLRGGKRVEILLRKVDRLDLVGRRDEVRAALDEAVELADGPLSRARVRRALGVHLARTSRNDEARSCLTEVLDLARAAGDRALEARATGNLGAVLRALGRHEEAIECHERSLRLARELGDGTEEAAASINLGNVLYGIGRADEAAARYERALQLARETGYRVAEAAATGSLGNIFRTLGRYGDAVRRYAQYLALSRETGNRLGEGIALVDLGAVHIRLGEADRARKGLEEALALSRESGARRLEAFALTYLGVLANQEGEAAEATRLLEESRALCRETGDRAGLIETLFELGRTEGSLGRKEEAVRLLDELLGLDPAPGTVLLASAHRAALTGGAAVADDARAGVHTRMEAQFVQWKATGERSLLEEARRLLIHLRDHAPEESRASILENVPLHREIVAASAP